MLQPNRSQNLLIFQVYTIYEYMQIHTCICISVYLYIYYILIELSAKAFEIWIRLSSHKTLHAFGLYTIETFYNNLWRGLLFLVYAPELSLLLFLSVANIFTLFFFFFFWYDKIFAIILFRISFLLYYFFVCQPTNCLLFRTHTHPCLVCVSMCVCVCVCVSAIFNFCKITANMKLCIIKTNDYLSSPFWPGTNVGRLHKKWKWMHVHMRV